MTQQIRSIAAAVSLVVSAGIVFTPLWIVTTAAAGESAETTLYSGVWTKKSIKSVGTWTILERSGHRYVRLSEDFKTRGAPDLKIFLSPLAASEATDANATDGSVLVALLESKSGEQEYPLPAGLNLGEYKSILIHCEQYSKLWSASDL